MSRELIYFDTEYRDDGQDPVVAAFISNHRPKPLLVDLRDREAGRAVIQSFLDERPDAVLVAHEAAADLGVLLVLGVDIRGRAVIDTRCEVRMLALSHPDFDLRKLYGEAARQREDDHDLEVDDAFSDIPIPRTRYGYSLYESLWLFNIPHEVDQAEKDACRDLVLHQTLYNEQEWRRIEDYCLSDVVAVRRLLPAIHTALVTAYRSEIIVLPEMVARGDYIRDCAILLHRTKGFPMDREWVQDIYEHRTAVINGLSENCNRHFDHPIYVKQSAKPDARYSFSFKGFDDWVRKQPIPIEWDLTECSRYRFESDYVDQQVAKYPFLKPLKETRDSIRAMSSRDLRELMTADGYIKARGNPYHTVTGRNGPKPREGFVLNLMPWQRSMIRPEPGRVFIGCDWSQQEIAIAAALSGDPLLIQAFLSGDVYLSMAKEAGAVPADGTKDDYPNERKAYKAVVLGLAYGKGRHALGLDIWMDLGGRRGKPLLTVDEAMLKAEEICDWHRSTYWVYWDWVEQGIQRARSEGYWRVEADGWTRFVEPETRQTSLLNYPIQSAGGLMLRRAIALLVNTDLDVVCSHHDAIYINSDPDRMAKDIDTLKSCMSQAAVSVCGHNIPIVVDTDIYTAEDGYWDERGADMHRMVKQHVEAAKAGLVGAAA